MTKVLMTVEFGDDEISLERGQRELGLDTTEVDQGFGLVLIRPDGLYALMVTDAAATRLSSDPRVKGPFVNPAIAPIPFRLIE